MSFLFAEGSSWGLDFTLLGYSSFMYFHFLLAIVTWVWHNTSAAKVQLSKLECWDGKFTMKIQIIAPCTWVLFLGIISSPDAVLLCCLKPYKVFSKKMIHTCWKLYSFYLIHSVFFLFLNEPSARIHYTLIILAVEMLYQTNNHVKDSSPS